MEIIYYILILVFMDFVITAMYHIAPRTLPKNIRRVKYKYRKKYGVKMEKPDRRGNLTGQNKPKKQNREH